MTSKPIVYDKAKYHRDSVEKKGLPEEQAEVHTAFYLGWLIDNDLYSEEFATENREIVDEYKRRKTTAMAIYEWWDCCLVDDMISERGKVFSQYYFDFENGKYTADYMKTFNVNGDNDFFTVEYTWDNYAKIRKVIDNRYNKWTKRQAKKWWEFWR